ncbi:hypothetical protein [Phyllobacterium phragmitis]|uniref:hypothetical protein n=1 Tax=Phyllobacterium phragmitis TaxID=2670329 RepID=UPI0011B23C91|nr:hypothetical protein [Phyllobacterium phragmitis]
MATEPGDPLDEASERDAKRDSANIHHAKHTDTECEIAEIMAREEAERGQRANAGCKITCKPHVFEDFKMPLRH